MTLDLADGSVPSSAFDVDAPLPPGTLPLPPHAAISSVALFTERVLRSPPLMARPIGARVSAPPASVWLAVSVFNRLDPSSPNGSVIIIRLPQFSDPVNSTLGGQNDTDVVPVYPPAAPPTLLNPAGISTAGAAAACGWNRYWNGTACDWVPLDTPASGLPAQGTAIEVRVLHCPSFGRHFLDSGHFRAGTLASHASRAGAHTDVDRLPALEHHVPCRVAEFGARLRILPVSQS